MIKKFGGHAIAHEATTEDDAASGRVETFWHGHTDNRRPLHTLRYRAYLDAGLIPATPWGIYTDAYDDLPTTVSAGLHRRGAWIASFRLCLFDPAQPERAGLPCEKVYPEIADIKAAAGGRIVELSRLALDPEIRNTRYKARLYAAAVRSAMLGALATDATQILLATQVKWRLFYEHVLGFKVVGAAQLYPPGDVPVILLSRPVDAALEKRIMSHSYFKVEPGEIDAIRAEILPLLDGGPVVRARGATA